MIQAAFLLISLIDSVDKLDPGDDVGELTKAAESPPSLLSTYRQWVHESEPALGADTIPGFRCPQSDRREGRHDRIGRPDMLPVHGGEVVECKQPGAILDQTYDGLQILVLAGRDETVERPLGSSPAVDLPDLMQRRLGVAVQTLRQLVEYLDGFVDLCRHRHEVHLLRNALAHAGKGERQMALALINTMFAQETPEAASDQWRSVAEHLRERFVGPAEMLNAAERDVLAYMGFPLSASDTDPQHQPARAARCRSHARNERRRYPSERAGHHLSRRRRAGIRGRAPRQEYSCRSGGRHDDGRQHAQ
jgi:hypothetical protein